MSRFNSKSCDWISCPLRSVNIVDDVHVSICRGPLQSELCQRNPVNRCSRISQASDHIQCLPTDSLGSARKTITRRKRRGTAPFTIQDRNPDGQKAPASRRVRLIPRTLFLFLNLWCNTPSHRYFVTTEIGRSKLPPFLIPL